MELLYTVQRKPNPNALPAPEIVSPVSGLCSLSTTGLIAFTSEDFAAIPGHNVLVADINAPWHTYKVLNSKYLVTALEWNITGTILLTADSHGRVKLWTMKDFMISTWTLAYCVEFPGEHIIRVAFFHSGRKVCLVADKRDESRYLEKFTRVKFAPSLRKFGGVGGDGCVVITANGMLGAFIIPKTELPPTDSPVRIEPVTESLGLTRNFFTTADIGYGKGGQFLVAVTNGEARPAMLLQCYRVQVQLNEDRLEIMSSSLPSFFVSEGAARELSGVRLQAVRWTALEDADALVVSVSHTGGCLVELWRLREEATPIHKLFQTNKNETLKTVSWATVAHYRHGVKAVSVAVAPVQLFGAPALFVGMADNSIHVLGRDTMKRLGGSSLSVSTATEEGKMMRIGGKLATLAASHLGQMLFAVDTAGQLYAFRCGFALPEPVLGNIVNSLEFCLVNGFDVLDLLLNIKNQSWDAIVEKLTENFHRQPAYVQQYYYVNFLIMKSNLYRMSTSGQNKSQDLTNLLMLHSILIAFKSLLRPSDLTSHDKGPAENLALALSESVPDVDKVLFNLEAKDFTVETYTLQSLQQLIQWVADLALNILARLPDSRGGSKPTAGYEISRDIVALNSIRELLVMIRIWGLLKPQCLPVFTRSSDNMDVLSTLFRLLTKLALNPNEPDDILLDECCALPSQVLIPQIQLAGGRTGVSSPSLPSLAAPLTLEFGAEPESLRFVPEALQVEGGMCCENVVDSVRYVLLGKCPRALRKCTRCGAHTSVNSVAKTPAMKSWEQRWANGCRCGGFWRLEVNENVY